MPRPVTCDMGHDEQVLAVYMVTELETGDVVALCGHCMLDLAAGMLRGAGMTVTTEVTQGRVIPPTAEDEEDTAENAVLLPERAQRGKTRRKLATRPDSATTSERDVPWPETSAATD